VHLAAAARRRWSLPPDSPLVVFFGFLHPVKGLEYLVRGMVRVRRQLPRARLVLAGGWDSLALPGQEGLGYRDRLLDLIRAADLQQAVQVTGYLDETAVSGLLFAADVVALPFTYGISFKSGSLLAAMAHGRPVVATQPALADPQLRPGEHLLCVPARDSESLAQAILAVLGNPDLQHRLALAGAAAAQPFNWPSIAARHLALYASVTAAS
jgi:glycosyltransferase involved in cell wall biosynthesis